jgi:hypothetical protein
MISLQIGLCKVKTNLMTIITEFYNKIKLYVLGHLEEIGVSFIIIFVGISSFLLGKYSVINSTVSNDRITFTDNTGATTTPKNSGSTNRSSPQTVTNKATGGQVVASKTGKKYYLPWCASAERILAKNKVFFASAFDAEKAGLTPASNCKGM